MQLTNGTQIVYQEDGHTKDKKTKGDFKNGKLVNGLLVIFNKDGQTIGATMDGEFKDETLVNGKITLYDVEQETYQFTITTEGNSKIIYDHKNDTQYECKLQEGAVFACTLDYLKGKKELKGLYDTVNKITDSYNEDKDKVNELYNPTLSFSQSSFNTFDDKQTARATARAFKKSAVEELKSIEEKAKSRRKRNNSTAHHLMLPIIDKEEEIKGNVQEEEDRYAYNCDRNVMSSCKLKADSNILEIRTGQGRSVSRQFLDRDNNIIAEGRHPNVKTLVKNYKQSKTSKALPLNRVGRIEEEKKNKSQGKGGR